MSELATIGDNKPPTEYEAISLEINDLYEEAKGWVDGEPVATQGQADSLDALIKMIKDAAKKADTLRKEEVQPYDEAKSSIQEKYNLLIGKTKLVTGKAVLALGACQDALTPWKQEQQAIKDEQARLAREEAARLQREADEAMKAASLEDREEAQKLNAQAMQAKKSANRVAKDNVKGMRTVWDVVITDDNEAFRSMWKTHKSEIMELVKSLAETDVRNSIRTIKGFDISSRKVAR